MVKARLIALGLVDLDGQTHDHAVLVEWGRAKVYARSHPRA
ncbi:MAG: hypothetical protein ABSA21_00075 [Candidatus Limnocylindrales bacterium]